MRVVRVKVRTAGCRMLSSLVSKMCLQSYIVIIVPFHLLPLSVLPSTLRSIRLSTSLIAIVP